MTRTLLTAIFLSLLNKAALATITTYETGEALLAAGKSFDLTLTTTSGAYDAAKLFVSCNSSDGYTVQLAVSSTIFPDRVDDQAMYEKIKYKVTGINYVEETEWLMNSMQYKNTFYAGDAKEFVLRLYDGQSLNMGVDGKIYQFDLAESKPHVAHMKSNCSS